MILRLPEPGLVVLVGTDGAERSAFARRHFRPTEVLSADAFRPWVADGLNDPSATRDALEILQAVAAKRLARGLVTVVNAANVTREARKFWLDLARRHQVTPVAIAFDGLTEILVAEGFQVWALGSPTEAVRIERQPARPESGPAAKRSAPELGPAGLGYLRPSPALPAVSRRPEWMEHPEEVFARFRRLGIGRAVCEETLGGSRAVVMVRRDVIDAKEGLGAVWARSGQRLFTGPALEKAFLVRLRDALDRAGFWDRLGTDWACLEGELTPASLQAGDLARRYAEVGAAARVALPKAVARLAEAGGRGLDVRELLARYRERYELSVRFVEACRRRYRRVRSVADVRFAPFHLLETEGAVHAARDPVWHLETLAEVCRAGPELLVALPYRLVVLGDGASEAEATRWWEERTEAGGEGMVVKPLDSPGPAMLCRGREALRLVYGPEYTLPANLERLRSRPRQV